MQSIIVFGGGGHAKVVIDIIEKQQLYHVAGVLNRELPIGQKVAGYPVLGNDEDLPEVIAKFDIHAAVVGVGDNFLRCRIAESIRKSVPNIAFVNAIHPSAQLGRDVSLGVGSVIMAGSVINSGTTLGSHCIVNTSSSIDHDCTIDDFVSFAPNSCAGGNVSVGKFSAICLGVNIIPNVSIGANTVVGAGATVLGDLPSGILAYGTPAKMIRRRPEPDEGS